VHIDLGDQEQHHYLWIFSCTKDVGGQLLNIIIECFPLNN